MYYLMPRTQVILSYMHINFDIFFLKSPTLLKMAYNIDYCYMKHSEEYNLTVAMTSKIGNASISKMFQSVLLSILIFVLNHPVYKLYISGMASD